MSLIVQKYGWTSVGITERIKSVAARVAKCHAQGDRVVVVVSAMSGVTDNLIKLAKEIMPLPVEREMDVLLATGEQTTIALTAMALHALNVPAMSLTGAQAASSPTASTPGPGFTTSRRRKSTICSTRGTSSSSPV